jgi:hypothetical protein
VVAGQGNGSTQHRWVTGVKPAGNIGGADQRNVFLVEPELVVSKTLADIRIEIDLTG